MNSLVSLEFLSITAGTFAETDLNHVKCQLQVETFVNRRDKYFLLILFALIKLSFININKYSGVVFIHIRTFIDNKFIELVYANVKMIDNILIKYIGSF